MPTLETRENSTQNQPLHQTPLPSKISGNDTEIPDEALITLIRDKNDRKAYNMLVQRYLQKTWRLAVSVLKNEEEAEDAVQDVFLSLMKSLQNWDLDGKDGKKAKFSTWIYRVTLNKCIDLKRKRKNTESSDTDTLTCDQKTAYQETLNNQLSEKLEALMKSLPDGQKDALKLYYFEEKSVREICKTLSKSEESIRSLLKRGKAGLKEKIAYDPHFKSLDIKGLSKQLWM